MSYQIKDRNNEIRDLAQKLVDLLVSQRRDGIIPTRPEAIRLALTEAIERRQVNPQTRRASKRIR